MTIEPVSLVERKDARAGLQMTFEPDSIRTRYDQWRPIRLHYAGNKLLVSLRPLQWR